MNDLAYDRFVARYEDELDTEEEFFASPVELVLQKGIVRRGPTHWIEQVTDRAEAHVRISARQRRSYRHQAAVLVVSYARANPDTEQEEQQQSTDQLSLQIPGEFTPSSELLRIWREASSSYRTPADEATLKEVSDLEAARQFGQALTQLLGAIGQEKRYSSAYSSAWRISHGGRFDPLVQLELCERFLIVPDKSPDFLGLLHEEITAHLRSGAKIRGGWGAVVLQNGVGDLVYLLNKPKLVRQDSFEKAREL